MQEMQNEAESLVRTPHSPAWPSPSQWGPVSRLGPQNLLPLRCYPRGGASCSWGRTRGSPRGRAPPAGGRGRRWQHRVPRVPPRGAEIRGVQCSSLDVCYGAGDAQNVTFTL